jgi:1,4-dihydroxy-2-naphthoate octaprenyltransferase
MTITHLQLLQVIEMESPGFNASACARVLIWVIIIACCVWSVSAPRLVTGIKTANAKAAASPEVNPALRDIAIIAFIVFIVFMVGCFLQRISDNCPSDA